MKEFEPGYEDFHRDIERYLTSIGMKEKRKDGMIVFCGYDDALPLMFRWYIENNALAALVREFRKWNWEYQYNDYLKELTGVLEDEGDWDNLKMLWEKGVLQKRKKLFNDMWKIEKDSPGTIPPKSFLGAKERLLETLGDIMRLARDHGCDEEVEKLTKIEKKVQQGKRA